MSPQTESHAEAEQDNAEHWLRNPWAVTIIGGIIVTLLGGFLYQTLFGNDRTSGGTAASPEVGDSVEAGPVAYELLEFRCSKSLREIYVFTPQGDLCMATFEVTNRSEDPASAFYTAFYLHIGDGDYGDADKLGGAFGTIFPDHSARGRVLFDIPSGTSPSSLTVSPLDGESVTFRID